MQNMSDEISTKTLAILLVVAIAISLGGTFFSLNRLSTLMNAKSSTGYITNPTGSAQVNITATGSLIFSKQVLDFGIGGVNTTGGNNFCTLTSGNEGGTKEGNDKCLDFNAANTFESLELENDGSKNLTITLDSDKDKATFLGGSSPEFQFYATNNETDACPSPVPGAWTEVNLTTMDLCGGTGLGFEDGADSLDIHLKLKIPYNSKQGLQLVTLTVTGTTAS
jgi:hypothetical protein